MRLFIFLLCVCLFIYRLGFSEGKGSLDYTKFLKAFEEGRADQYAPAPADVTHYRHFDGLSAEKAEAKLSKYVTEQAAAITAVSTSCRDKPKTV